MTEPRGSHAHQPAGVHVVERAEKNPLASQQILKQLWKQLPGARREKDPLRFENLTAAGDVLRQGATMSDLHVSPFRKAKL
jgi:hypothetical protein